MHLGIDIGGTKLAGVLLDAQGAVRWQRRAATPATFADAAALLAGWAEDADAEANDRVTMGLCAPGLIREGVSFGAVNLPWSPDGGSRDPWAPALQQRLARPVAVCNDGDAFALAEYRALAVPVSRLAAITLGTGLGGGSVVDGRAVQGGLGQAGEFGHLPLPWRRAEDPPARACGCGRFDCIETLLSGEGLRRLWQLHTGTEPVAPAAMLAAVRANEAGAVRVRDAYADMLARLCVMLLQVLEPELIVLGGSIADLPGLPEATAQAIPRHALGNATIPVRRGRVDGEGAAIGAAWMGRGVTECGRVL